MKYFKYELKKLFSGKLFIWLLLLMIVANIGFGVFHLKMFERSPLVDPDQYTKNIDDIIYTAKMNYISMDDKNSEAANYQLEIIDRYTKLKEIEPSESISGYPDLLTSFIPFIFSAFFTIIIAIMLVHYEWSANLIITSFQNKRIRIYFLKILVLLASSVGTALSFCGSYFIGLVLSGTKFTGGGALVQSVERFMSCPYGITLIEAVLLRFLVAVSVVFVISLVVFAIGNVLRNAVFTVLSTMLIIASDLVLSKSFDGDIFSIFYNINLNHFITDQWLQKFRGMQLIGFCSQLTLLLIIGIILIILCVAVSVIAFHYAKAVTAVRHKRSKKSREVINRGTLIGYEIKKVLSGKAIVGIVLLLVVYFYLSFAQLTNINSDYEKIYKYHVDQMASMSFDEQMEYSTQTKGELSKIIRQSYEMIEKFKKEEVTAEEYNEALQRAGAAELEQEVFRVIDDQLNAISQINEEGVPAKLIYSSGWNLLISSEINIVLIFALIWMYSLFFCSDHENRFAMIVTGCFVGQKKGRRKIEVRRITVVVVISVLLTVNFNFIELLPIHNTYPFGKLSEYVIGTGIEMDNIYLRFVDIFIIRAAHSLLGICVLVALIRFLSSLLKRPIFVMLTAISFELLMMLIGQATGGHLFGLASYFDFSLLFIPYFSVALQTVCLLGTIILVELILIKRKGKHISLGCAEREQNAI